ncbi:hypothetical protein KAFR_0A02630 [Kazachstania africana CBS 2517]|uniref:Ubiquitin-like protease family profile domain-containing protein n=1 Tax=Kazachstania africana (strain ATCC 22294 / BCRC 22015 / CBS 2517 / CECT 1963 / NBRC 1671 / NRRL Y-8276) TaxID=1071382 RepID=H2AMU9_KAZAF|nr:hypothetical protein KAFR_0A02630 [Kazachstania africana CBS 2517]CCF55699.1 hypothetical protein KAFR_0A02630 [Kazachstania africana CBS 2517]
MKRPRRANSNGLIPMDNLSSPTSISQDKPKQKIYHHSPVRYRSNRRDPKIVNEINHGSTRTLLPDFNEPVPAASMRKVDENKVTDLESFTPSEYSPLKRKRVRNNQRNMGLLYSSPPPKRNDLTIITKFTISGTFGCIDYRGKKHEVLHNVNLNFINDGDDPKLTFEKRSSNILNSITNLTTCPSIYFDEKFDGIALILPKVKSLMLNGNRINTRNLIWQKSKEDPDNDHSVNSKLYKIYKLISLNCKISKVETFKDVLTRIEKWNQREIEDEKEKNANISIKEAFDNKHGTFSRNNFLNKNLNSLGFPRGSSTIARTANKIHIPITTTNDNDNDNATNKPISTSNFYNKPSHASTPTSLRDFESSSLRRSTRSSKPLQQSSNSLELDPQQEHEVVRVFKPRLRYKFVDGTNYTVSNQDFKCLYNNDWINDSIIDFFIKYFVEVSIKNEIVRREEVHIMSSFFYTKLISDSADYYNNVRSWVTNSNLFLKKFIILPININYHWFGCIITNLNELFNFFKDNSNTIVSSQENSDDISISSPIVQVLTFDSLRGTHSREIDPIKDFLISYAKDKYSINIDRSFIKMKTCLVPQQPNMSDCGVHVIMTIKRFFEHPAETIEIWKTARLKNRHFSTMINEYFDKKLRDKARKQLRAILWRLQKDQIDQMKENGESPNSSDEGIQDYEDEDIEIIEDIIKHPPVESNSDEGEAEEEDGITKSEKAKSLADNSTVRQPLSSDPPTPEGEITKNNLLIFDSLTASNKDSRSEPSTEQQEEALIEEQSKLRNASHVEGVSGYVPVDRSSSSSSSNSIPLATVLHNRKYLESSPRKSVNDSAGPTKSKYFGESDLKKRADEFDGKMYLDVVSSPLSQIDDRKLSFSATESSKADIHDLDDSPPSSPFSTVNNSSVDVTQNVVVSDPELDDDVNLIGGNRVNDSSDNLSSIRKKVEEELESSTPSVISDTNFGKDSLPAENGINLLLKTDSPENEVQTIYSEEENQ